MKYADRSDDEAFRPGNRNGGYPAAARSVAAIGPANDPDLAQAEALYASRRRRDRFLGADLLGEPAWDILLDLYIAWKRGITISTSSACLAAQVPATTALRWLQVLHDRNLIHRHGDERDQRRTLVRLSPQGIVALEAFLEADRAAADGPA